MPDTLWTFARLKISVAGTTLRTTRRRRHRWNNGTTIAYDNGGVPRGTNVGEYEGSTEVELSTQEASQIYEAVEQGGGDMNNLVTISDTWSPKQGEAGNAEAQGFVPEGRDRRRAEQRVDDDVHDQPPRTAEARRQVGA